MLDTNFDRLARVLATGQSRRRIIAGLAGVAAPLLPWAGKQAAAACKKVNQNCDRNKDCCAHAHCPTNKCRCKSGFSNCNNECFDLDIDEDHCGSCSVACAGGERCCDGDCVDLDFDPNNCGSCGHACDATEECELGVCRIPLGGCDIGANSCDGSGPNPTCGGTEDCVCRQSTEGVTKCAQGGPGVCGQCESSADCASISPLAFCASSEPDCCGPDLKNTCRLPCSILPNP